FPTPSPSSPGQLRDTYGSFRCFHDPATGQSSQCPLPPAGDAWLLYASPHEARSSWWRGWDKSLSRIGRLSSTGSRHHDATGDCLWHWERPWEWFAHPAHETKLSTPERFQATMVWCALYAPYQSVARRC